MNKKEQRFVQTVWDFYAAHKRASLPWRQTSDPYRIAVSEIMLQQTQVDRVIPKYEAFLEQFKDTKTLAKAPLGDVLVTWQGLGYNRRAKMLWQCAGVIMEECAGVWPVTYDALLQLPGVGPYTAGAVMAFAYDEPVPIIETNIRTVYLYHFFKHKENVPEADLMQKIERTLPTKNAREWYSALMDYGSHLKKQHGNLNKKAKAYNKQSTFAGSDRQIRGQILKEFGARSFTKAKLSAALSTFTSERIQEQLDQLVGEEMVVKTKRSYHLPR